MTELVSGRDRASSRRGENAAAPCASIAWTRVTAGTAKFLALEPAFAAGDQPLPARRRALDRGRRTGCTVLAEARDARAIRDLWPAVDRIHLAVVARIVAAGLRAWPPSEERQRLSQRTELTHDADVDSLERLAETVVGEIGLGAGGIAPRRSAACRAAASSAAALGTSLAAVGPAGHGTSRSATCSRLPARRACGFARVQLREQWWTLDVGPLVAWRGEERDPVALIRRSPQRLHA